MTILADLSRYDPQEAAGQYDGVILNVEDPGVAGKAATAHGAGKVVMLYSWVYPGSGGGAVARGISVAQSVGVPVRGIWLDYEQDGVAPNDIRNARAAGTGGYRFGVYAYMAMMNAQGTDLTDAIGDWPLWMAYYPGRNDGSYDPTYSNDARGRGAVMHQWTSSGGTRDLNMVLDDAWYATWSGGTPPKPPEEDDEVLEYIWNMDKTEVWETNRIHKRHVKPDEWNVVVAFTPEKAVIKGPLSQEWWDSIPVAGGSGTAAPAGELHINLSGTAAP